MKVINLFTGIIIVRTSAPSWLLHPLLLPVFFNHQACSQSSLPTDFDKELDDDFPYDLQDQWNHAQKTFKSLFFDICISRSYSCDFYVQHVIIYKLLSCSNVGWAVVVEIFLFMTLIKRAPFVMIFHEIFKDCDGSCQPNGL